MCVDCLIERIGVSATMFASVDCTTCGVLVVTSQDSNQIQSLNPTTGAISVLAGGGDFLNYSVKFVSPQQIVLCDGDRSAYALDEHTLRHVTLPELDQSIFVEPKSF